MIVRGSSVSPVTGRVLSGYLKEFNSARCRFDCLDVTDDGYEVLVTDLVSKAVAVIWVEGDFPKGVRLYPYTPAAEAVKTAWARAGR